MYLDVAAAFAQRKAAEGEGLYVQGCVSCHGLTGLGDAAPLRSLSKLPTELGSFPWQVEQTDDQLAQAIAAGVPGSPMPPSSQLTPAQVQAVVSYVRTLPTRERTMAAAAAATRGQQHGDGREQGVAGASRPIALRGARWPLDRRRRPCVRFLPRLRADRDAGARARSRCRRVDGAAVHRVQGRDQDARHAQRRASARCDRREHAACTGADAARRHGRRSVLAEFSHHPARRLRGDPRRRRGRRVPAQDRPSRAAQVDLDRYRRGARRRAR